MAMISQSFLQILLNALPTPGPSSRFRVFFVALVEKDDALAPLGEPQIEQPLSDAVVGETGDECARVYQGVAARLGVGDAREQ